MRLGIMTLLLVIGLLALALTAPEGKRRGLQEAEAAAAQEKAEKAAVPGTAPKTASE